MNRKKHIAKKLNRKVWDALNPKYASLDHPEWLDQVPIGFWQDQHNHKRYMKWLKKKLGLKRMDDWYGVTTVDYSKNRGNSLLSQYNFSRVDLLKAVYPGRKWMEWKFNVVPARFWEDRKNRVRYLKWLGGQLGFRKIEDWYHLKARHFNENRGAGLLKEFQYSLLAIVKEIFPKHQWLEWKFSHLAQGFWNNRCNCIRYVNWLKKQLGYKKLDDWYQATGNDFKNHFGTYFISLYHGNVANVVMDLFPKHKWHVWKFHQVPQGYWKVRENRIEYMKWLGKQLGYKKMEDWYQLQSQDVISNYGDSMMLIFRHSAFDLVKDSFPDYQWVEWKFCHVTSGFWDNRKNRIRYMDWLGNHLGFKKLDNWYNLTLEDVNQNYGRGLCRKFNSSPMNLVRDTYAKKNWYEWQFRQIPSGFWNIRENRIRYMKWLGKQLGYKKMEDWYQVKCKDFEKHSGSTMSKFYNALPCRALKDCFPDYQWLDWKFSHLASYFWEDRKNQVRYLNWLGNHLGFVKAEDWYKLTTGDFVQNNGKGLLKKFDLSLAAVVKELFPKKKWYEWKFRYAPKGFWDVRENRIKYLKWLQKELGFRRFSGWYKVKNDVLRENYATSLIIKYKNVSWIVMDAFPDNNWLKDKFLN